MGTQVFTNVSASRWLAQTVEFARRTQPAGSVRRPPSAPPNGRSRTDEVLFSKLALVIADMDSELMVHAQRTEFIAREIGRALELPPPKRDALSLGALLHDVGKVHIPKAILDKPGPLTPEEWEVVKGHPVMGYEMLREFPELEAALPVVRHHHERFDGTGYPDGLAGQAIPLEARIMAVSDAFDAMRSDRPYRPRLSLEETVAELTQGRGRQFDPTVVDAFLQHVLPAMR